MLFSELSSYLEKLEKTASRNSMVEILSELFIKAKVTDIDKICYLTQGRVAPLFMPIEFGLSDKLMIRVIAKTYDLPHEKVRVYFGGVGDIGITAEDLKERDDRLRLGLAGEKGEITVSEVFQRLLEIANSSGSGSQEKKLLIMSDLLRRADSLSARYLARIPVNKLRLGFSDMTVLDSLSWMIDGTKRNRPEIERAFNVRPDLGFIAKVIKEDGISGLKKVGPKVGTPIVMARAERLPTAREIIQKIGRCAVEPKIDGFRVAVHFRRMNHESRIMKGKGTGVTLFSRNMENTTDMFPDIVEGVLKQVNCEEAIFEGEAVAYNPDTGEYLPFQETVQRKRKYDIEKVSVSVPLRLFCFDILYLDGKNLLNEPYKKRREILKKVIRKGDDLSLTQETVVETADDLEKLFDDAVSRGLEGIMVKRLDGVYQAGARGFNWIKFKRSYSSKLTDTIDAVVMGYDFGQGKRAGFGIGGFLIGVYDKKTDTFKTIAKIGTGLTDEEWKKLKVQSSKFKVSDKPARYDVDKLMNCDVWVRPEMVVVVKADEITRSPVHTAGKDREMGYALRFPRLVDFRGDKISEDATTVSEIEEMYGLQGRVNKVNEE